MSSYKNQRMALLIDAENLEIQARNDYGLKIDYEKLLQEVSDYQLIRSQYFKPLKKITKSWARSLTEWGYEVKTTPKNADSWLIISAITLAEKCDVIRLVAGDADYLPLVNYLQSKGVLVEIMMFESCTSFALREIADAYIPMSTELLLENSDSNIIPITPNRRKCYA